MDICKYPWIILIAAIRTGIGTNTYRIYSMGDEYHTTHTHGYPLPSQIVVNVTLPVRAKILKLYDPYGINLDT